MPTMRRTTLTVLIVLIWLLATASPASAHTVSGVGATNWRTSIVGITPAVDGLSAKVVEEGSRIQLTNHGAEVTVLGYEGEPYLRVGPDGVFDNVLSSATYLNCSRQQTNCSIPPDANPQAPPQWRKVSSGQTVRWHDHRTHWMAPTPPPQVTRAPNQVHVLQPPWTVSLRQGGTAITLTGNLTWVPGPSPWPWLLLAFALLVGAVCLGVFGAWGAPLAAAVAALTVNDVYHAAAIARSVAGGLGTQLGRFFTGSFYSIIGWILGQIAARFLLRRRVDGLYAAAFAGVSAALFTGLLDISVLSRSQAPFAGPIGLDRVTVAVSLGLGVGVAIGSILALRSVPRQEYDEEDEADDAGVGADLAPGPD